jgi:hypothetical protein
MRRVLALIAAGGIGALVALWVDDWVAGLVAALAVVGVFAIARWELEPYSNTPGLRATLRALRRRDKAN